VRERDGQVAADHERRDTERPAQRVEEPRERQREDEPERERAPAPAVEVVEERDPEGGGDAPGDEEHVPGAAGDEPREREDEQERRDQRERAGEPGHRRPVRGIPGVGVVREPDQRQGERRDRAQADARDADAELVGLEHDIRRIDRSGRN
jgi:hypothetical protein